MEIGVESRPQFIRDRFFTDHHIEKASGFRVIRNAQRIENAGTDLALIRSGMLADAIKAGDKAVEQIVRRAAGFLGVAVGNIINLLLPDVVILGGGLMEAMPELILEEVEKTAGQRVAPPFVKVSKIVPAKLGDDAGVRGAAAWVAKQVESKQTVG